MEHESELGRQTAISIPQKKGIITVAIQEFTEEGTVNISFMAVGSWVGKPLRLDCTTGRNYGHTNTSAVAVR